MIEISCCKTLGSAQAPLHLQVDLALEPQTFITLSGKSGAGKTSLFRLLAGLLQPDRGRIVVNGIPWVDTDRKLNLPPQKRQIGYVFQDYALFPHMTVLENLRFALRKGQNPRIVADLLEMMELGGLQQRKPHQLSGGQQQRVALARAIAPNPKLLLLDEPLSALDRGIRTKLQDYLRLVHQTFGLTTLLISHDVAEIVKLSDRVILLDQGKVVRQGRPMEVYSSQTVSGKFQFIGEVLSLEQQDVIFIVAVLIGQDLVKVVADPQEAASLRVGDRVLVASKAFNPIIRPLVAHPATPSDLRPRP
ncbi:ABC transporter ATP-binding protein [Lyngbya confervoides]|uniref:ABC transporter ATP-binding protein n=1 Tax=Lyngbya confervoides BDU141951 TaxID=1574623 RepID=A0ABD4T1D3_9CYAN|nr:ABC transporter ATP-binding protein [Lyngbya confervoides]MCM1982379.1 ABC transporter ATP-binding protein [Lyngbya confervoides BDU141951]